MSQILLILKNLLNLRIKFIINIDYLKYTYFKIKFIKLFLYIFKI